MKLNIAFVVLLLFASSCNWNPVGYKYETGQLPNVPVNLFNFNTAYDDYNSTAPSLGKLVPFCFSSNRGSTGEEFNIIYQPMNIHFDKKSGVLEINNSYNNWASVRSNFEVLKAAINKIETDGNEFGPNLIADYLSNEFRFTLMYSSDVTGDTEISFVSNHSQSDFSDPKAVNFLNSEFDDLYPSFATDRSQLYFCSNRNDDRFDFYYVNVNPNTDLELLLSDTSSYEVFRDQIISSEADDKCPFIFNDRMVFASNRDGGYGGYDLYYSVYKDGNWGEAINFGEKINTEFDEFRPILIEEDVSPEQTMMVFSSNRTGGEGGFDLYYLGIPN